MNQTNENENTHNAETVTIPKPTPWEIRALMAVNKRYWDEHVLICESWEEAREQIAIDGLLNSLLDKLEWVSPSPVFDKPWPLEDEERLRHLWIESGGRP